MELLLESLEDLKNAVESSVSKAQYYQMSTTEMWGQMFKHVEILVTHSQVNIFKEIKVCVEFLERLFEPVYFYFQRHGLRKDPTRLDYTVRVPSSSSSSSSTSGKRCLASVSEFFHAFSNSRHGSIEPSEHLLCVLHLRVRGIRHR